MEHVKPVLVVGATGILGTEICRLLRPWQQPVSALVRPTSDPAKVEGLRKLGARIVTGDLKDPDSLAAACQGVRQVITTASSTISRQEGDSIETVDRKGQMNVIDAAASAGVEHFTFVSFPDLGGSFPLQDAKRAAEERLKMSGLTYTILRPTMFMEVWLGPALGFDYTEGKATIFGGGANKVSWIAVADVAAFAVESLSNPAARNATIELGGPEALSPLEVVRIFERESGRTFTLQHVSEEALEAQRAAASDPLQQSFTALMQAYAAGNVIPMEAVLQKFPLRLTSVRAYCRKVAPPRIQVPELL